MNLRADMPLIAAWIDDMRDGFGAECINDTIRRGMRGEPVFWAQENGHSVGTRLVSLETMDMLDGVRSRG